MKYSEIQYLALSKKIVDPAETRNQPEQRLGIDDEFDLDIFSRILG